MLTRVYAISDPSEAPDAEYMEGLRAAVAAAVAYGIAVVERGEERSPQLPSALRSQARLAARNGVSLDTVLRRYFAGHALVGDFLIEEAERGDLDAAPLQRLFRTQATLLDRLLAAVSEEHSREAEERQGSSEQRRAEHVRGLLAGELLDTAELEYEFDAHHLGVIAAGPGAADGVRGLARALDRRLLAVEGGEGTLWAWLGGRRAVNPDGLERTLSESRPADLSLALGEPAQGLAGWRLTHQQARAALPIALRRPRTFTRYADVALLASSLQDDLLATSLRELYLAPLARERDGGEVLRQTLRAYFAAERNISSAASALGVTRQTVCNRLHSIEERLSRPLSGCAAEIETALRLEDMGHPAFPHTAFSHG